MQNAEVGGQGMEREVGARRARAGAWLGRRSLPVKIGMGFAAAAILLAVVGIARGNVPLNPLSIFLAVVISGGSWGIVSWAVATAVVDVEQDVAEAEQDD
jgi:hypothetical protein